MLFKVDGQEKEIQLYAHIGGAWVDRFTRLETVVPTRYDQDEDGAYIIPRADYELLVDYWREQVNAFEDGQVTRAFGDPDASDASGWLLSAD